MGYVLLWVENLAVLLLLMALILACVGHLHRRWLRRALWAPVWLVVFLLLCFANFLWWAMLREDHAWAVQRLIPLFLLTGCFVVGSLWLLIRGFRRTNEEPAPTVAGNWPRGKLSVALAAAIALHLMTFWNLDLESRQQLAALRIEAGALAQSVAPPKVPDRNNAAVIYREASEAMGCRRGLPAFANGEGKPRWMANWNVRWRPSEESGKFDLDLHDPALRHFLEQATPTLALLRQAAGMPACCFDREYARPSIGMLLPELFPMQTGAELLALDTICQAADGNRARAVEDLNCMFLMSEHIGSDPQLTFAVLTTNVDRNAVAALEAILSSGSFASGELAPLKIPDGASRYKAMFDRAFYVEDAYRLAVFAQSGRDSIEEMPASLNVRMWRLKSCIYRVFLLSDDLAAENSYAASLAGTLRFYSYSCAEKMLRELDDGGATRRGQLVMGPFLRGRTTGPYLAMTRADASLSLARLGVAAYCYRAKHENFPEKLDELVPDFVPFVPVDPFDGKPMKMKRTDHGLTIYSIGPDLVDNGGAPMDWAHRTGDITFELTNAKPPADNK